VSVLEVVGGWLRLVVWVVATCTAAGTLRRWALPTALGALAALVDVVVALTFTVIVMEVSGTIGLFSRWNVLGGVVVVSATVVGLARRFAPPPPESAPVADDGTPWRDAHNVTDRLPFVVTGLIAVGFGGLAAATTTIPIAITVVTWTFGEMIFFPTSVAYVAEMAPPGKTGEYMGMFSSSMSLALIIGPWLGAFLLDRVGAPATWFTMFVLGLSATALFVFSSATMRGPSVVAAVPETEDA